MTQSCHIFGAPVQSGAGRSGCIMGPDAFRTAGLPESLADLGWLVTDLGDVEMEEVIAPECANPAVHHLAETIGWTQALNKAAYDAAQASDLPIFMGGDHSLSCGTVLGVANYAATQNRPLFVLWLDAHPDIHSPLTTDSGNLHGTPLGYFTGQPGFDGWPEVSHPVDTRNICMLGLRSVDNAERRKLAELGVDAHDMRSLDENGVAAPLRAFLERVVAANGMLHVSLDVDFLEPGIAPAVGTTVPGGATFREAHLIMEMLHDSGLVTSIDLVELNPFLDDRGKTAMLMTDLCASLFGRRVLDRVTGAY
ncbi:MAG: arginase [Rhodobacteraceae bacterium]|nr:arginase [Paracoccaceae bacterium]